MDTRKEKAADLKRQGTHNCAQAVACTYSDFTGLDADTLKEAGNSFAASMGNMEGTCGALVAAEMLLGLKNERLRVDRIGIFEVPFIGRSGNFIDDDAGRNGKIESTGDQIFRICAIGESESPPRIVKERVFFGLSAYSFWLFWQQRMHIGAI